tara:strand:- start:326 stop:535 length:210 start_codon:yes stop_codon:yes gene_type:complete
MLHIIECPATIVLHCPLDCALVHITKRYDFDIIPRGQMPEMSSPGDISDSDEPDPEAFFKTHQFLRFLY